MSTTVTPEPELESLGTKRSRSVRYFESVAESYLGRYGEATPAGRALRERKDRLLAMLGQVEGRVLDVGCGPGVMAGDMVNAGCDFLGVDASVRMLVEGRRRFPAGSGVGFVAADAAALPLPGCSFDVVVCTGVVDRLARPTAAIEEMARVLKPGGVMVISFPNLHSPYAAWRSYVFLPGVLAARRVAHAMTGRPAGPGMFRPVRLWTRARARRVVSSAGGWPGEVVFVNFNVLLSPLDELFPLLAARLARRFGRLGRTPLRWVGAAFLLRAVKQA